MPQSARYGWWYFCVPAWRSAYCCLLQRRSCGLVRRGSLQVNMQFPPIVQTVREIGFSCYANLEVELPSNQRAEEMHKNLTSIR